MGKYLSKADILSAKDLAFEDVDVPEWGGAVRVKMLSALEKDQFESEQFEIRVVNGKPHVETHMENKSARLAGRCIVDEDGKRLFSDGEIDQLAAKSAAALARVVTVAQRINKIDAKQVASLAEALKNDQPVSGVIG